MRLPILLLCGALLLPALTWAAPQPMTPKDLALLLRSGIPKPDIFAELTKRRLSAPLDAAGEAILSASGATPSLIAEIKTGNFTLTEAQAAAVAKQNEAVRSAAALASSSQRSAPQTPPQTQAVGGSLQSRLDGKLIKLSGDNVQDCSSSELSQVRFYVIYQSAHWCGPCRQFTPKLVEFYRRMKPLHPEFEIIFASCDRDEASMTSYMRSEKMPWPTLRFAGRELLNQYCGSGIPWLVVVDSQGQPLTKNGIDKQYLAPDKVLAQLEKEFLH